MTFLFRNIFVIGFVLLFASQSLVAQIVVKLGGAAPVGTPWADDLDSIKARVESESNQTISIKILLGGQAGSESEILQGIRKGRIQGGGLTAGAIASIIPEIDILEIPYLFDSPKEADCVLDNHLLESFRSLFLEKGFIFASWAENGFRNIGNKNKEIRTPNDLRGMKLRSQESKIHLEFWRKMGVHPVPIAIPEVLPSLQIGVVEGFDQTVLMTIAADWQTSIQYYSLTEHIYQPAAVIYSKTFFDKLNQKQRKIIIGNGNGMAIKSRQAVREMSEKLLSVLKENSVIITKLSTAEKLAFKNASLGIGDIMVKRIGGQAPMLYDKIKKAKFACGK